MAFKFFKSSKSKSAKKVTTAALVATTTPSAPTASQQQITGSQTIPQMTNNNTSGSFGNNVQPTSPTASQQAPQQVITGSQTIGKMTNNNTSGSYNNNVNANNTHSTVSGDITMTGFGIPSNAAMAAYPFVQGTSHVQNARNITFDGQQSPADIAQILGAAGVPADVNQKVMDILQALQANRAGGFQQPHRILQQG